MSPDFINGMIELVGGGLTFMNVRRIWLDKQAKGVSWFPIAFFTVWGLWNLFYYPHLDQWWSFAGGILIVFANSLWVGLLLYYTYNPPKPPCEHEWHADGQERLGGEWYKLFYCGKCGQQKVV